MKQPRDKFGKIVKSGDLLLEFNESYEWSKEYPHRILIWEYKSPLYFTPDLLRTFAARIAYSVDGVVFENGLSFIDECVKISKKQLTKELKFKFNHGMYEVWSSCKDGNDAEIINNSNIKNYRFTEKELEKYEYLKTIDINSVDDLIDNVDIIMEGSVPGILESKIMKFANIDKVKIVNGEVGIAAYGLHERFLMFMEIVKHNKNNKEELIKIINDLRS